MRRICLFAGYDKTNIIQDYVVYYLKELSSVSDVYYMADNEISEVEKLKIAPYVKGAYGFQHKKYDFGSWQELINIIGWEKILEYDELILANDSVFGPVYPIKKLIEKIENDTEWDICGINRALKNNIWHISSYFLIFRKQAFTCEIFREHLSSIKEEKNIEEVIDKYEVPFMKKFYNNGYIVKVFSGLNKNIYFHWQDFCNLGVPFIKKKVFTKKLYSLCSNDDWKKYVNSTSYNINYIIDCIKNDETYTLENTGNKRKKKSRLKKIYKWLIRINIKKGKFYFKLFGFYIVKINKKNYTYILFGKPMKSKLNAIPIKIIN